MCFDLRHWLSIYFGLSFDLCQFQFVSLFHGRAKWKLLSVSVSKSLNIRSLKAVNVGTWDYCCNWLHTFPQIEIFPNNFDDREIFSYCILAILRKLNKTGKPKDFLKLTSRLSFSLLSRYRKCFSNFFKWLRKIFLTLFLISIRLFKKIYLPVLISPRTSKRMIKHLTEKSSEGRKENRFSIRIFPALTGVFLVCCFFSPPTLDESFVVVFRFDGRFSEKWTYKKRRLEWMKCWRVRGEREILVTKDTNKRSYSILGIFDICFQSYEQTFEHIVITIPKIIKSLFMERCSRHRSSMI